MTYSIKIKFAENGEIEVSGDSPNILAKLVNEATKKFFSDTKWANKDLES